jgi:hypothetical protein
VAQSPDSANPGQFLTQYGYDFTLTTSSMGNAATGSGSSSGSGGSTGSGSSGGAASGSGGNAGGASGGTGETPVTRPANAPSLGGLRIKALGSGSATVTETLNTSAATSYYLAYGTTAKLTQRTSIGSSTKSGTVTWRLRGLRAGKVYYLQAVAANSGGTRRSGTIRVKTSAVSVRKITANGSQLVVSLHCGVSASCPVKLAVKVGNTSVASGRATVRGNHTATITLKLNRAAAARAAHGHTAQAALSAISVWNRYAATVVAKFRLALG